MDKESVKLAEFQQCLGARRRNIPAPGDQHVLARWSPSFTRVALPSGSTSALVPSWYPALAGGLSSARHSPLHWIKYNPVQGLPPETPTGPPASADSSRARRRGGVVVVRWPAQRRAAWTAPRGSSTVRQPPPHRFRPLHKTLRDAF